MRVAPEPFLVERRIRWIGRQVVSGGRRNNYFRGENNQRHVGSGAQRAAKMVRRASKLDGNHWRHCGTPNSLIAGMQYPGGANPDRSCFVAHNLGVLIQCSARGTTNLPALVARVNGLLLQNYVTSDERELTDLRLDDTGSLCRLRQNGQPRSEAVQPVAHPE